MYGASANQIPMKKIVARNLIVIRGTDQGKESRFSKLIDRRKGN
jgi:hypothetical protein